MKTIIAGSRSICKYSIVKKAIEKSRFEITTVISGGAIGVDTLGEDYGAELSIPIIKMPAEWDKYGRKAGHLRNEQMADIAEALIAIWDGVSRGTMHMINIAKKKGLKVFVYRIDEI